MAAVEAPPISTRPAVLFDLHGTLLIRSRIFVPAHGDWIRSLSEQADVYYISTHGPEAHEVFGKKLGLPEFDWIECKDYGPSYEPTSRSLAIDALFPMRAVAWVDDFVEPREHAWADDRDQNHARTLLIQPNRHRGIQPHHMQQLTDWVGSVATVRA
ncbi:MAG: hypothetical protein JWO35_466 [Candidatus Saccharibacteria bacterium]|nr:hypothetical protein [Candidatus Saccharibacteria bacterium]